jgi:hypothetical protein
MESERLHQVLDAKGDIGDCQRGYLISQNQEHRFGLQMQGMAYRNGPNARTRPGELCLIPQPEA